MVRTSIAGFLLVGSLGGAVIAAAPIASAVVPYEDCAAARQDGASDIPSSSPYYGPWLDRDNDGIGCES
jgi:hypothetical protein